jgi:hypothetical protein
VAEIQPTADGKVPSLSGLRQLVSVVELQLWIEFVEALEEFVRSVGIASSSFVVLQTHEEAVDT